MVYPVSIRYIAVLGFQPAWREYLWALGRGFHPLYRGTWFPTMAMFESDFWVLARFHPLYRGTWFPTLPQKHPL